MANLVKAYRLQRLFPGSGANRLVVALTRASADEAHEPSGGKEMVEMVRAVAAAGPPAMELTLEQAHRLQGLEWHPKPALLLRADVTNARTRSAGQPVFCRMIENAMEQSVRLDAAGVSAGLVAVPGAPEVTAQCVANLRKMRRQCGRWCLPLTIEVEALPMAEAKPGEKVRMSECLAGLMRLAVELGADLIQTRDRVDAAEFHGLVKAARGLPVLVRGSAEEPDFPERANAYLRAGAAGMVCEFAGLTHGDPGRLIRSLRAMIGDGKGDDGGRGPQGGRATFERARG